MGTWLTSDPHFGHRLVSAERGFETAELHDRALLRTFRKAFQETDDIWWLGDIAFDGWAARIENYMPLIPGRHHLVLGNHDRAHPLHSRGHNYQNDFRPFFLSVSLHARVSYEGKGALLSHFPYSGDHTDRDRFEEWRLPDVGKPLFHGHTHSADVLSFTAKGTPQVSVGLDAWGLRPVSIFEAFEVLNAA